MKRRITLIHRPEDGVDPASVRVDGDAVSGPEVLAAREERLTFRLDELPDDVVGLLGRYASQLHAKWATSSSFELPELLSSRVPPGLHVFYTPAGNSESDESTHLCSSLNLLFGELGCGDPDSFVKLPPVDGDARNDAFQYYQPYELDRLIEGLERTLCVSTADAECSSRVQGLRSAASMDFSYDSSSETLKLQAIWPSGTHAVRAKPVDGHTTEIGVFTTDPSAGDAHELGVGGILAAAPGESKEPSILAFAVQSRHRGADASFSAKFLEPHGLHPTLQLSISSAAIPADYEDQGGCGLHAYLTLPRTVFADRYQLADELFMASMNLSSLVYASQPVDLEMPEYKNPPWGSTVLVELAPPEASADAGSPWTAEIPLHLRYRAPAEGGYSEARIPYPAVFWACQATEKAAFSGNPWDRASLGYDALFKPTTGFWHVEPRPETEGGDLTVAAKVPVLAPEKSGWVETGTAATILVGFAWVLFSLFSAARGEGGSRGKDARAKKEQ